MFMFVDVTQCVPNIQIHIHIVNSYSRRVTVGGYFAAHDLGPLCRSVDRPFSATNRGPYFRSSPPTTGLGLAVRQPNKRKAVVVNDLSSA
jgi:hypothetical protein